MRVAQRLFLAVIPAVLGVLSVAALAYWGQYQRQAPRWIVVVAAIASVLSLWLAWRNTRFVAHRIERLASGPRDSEPEAAGARRPAARLTAERDELDSIERVVGDLSSAVSVATDEGRRRERAAEERVQEYATLLAEASAAVAKHLEEVRLPLHILLESRFGELNENQEEMVGAARAAAESADVELGRLRDIADIDRGALSLTRDLVRPADVIQSLLPTLVAQGEREGVTVLADVEPALPRVTAHRARLQEAMGLLLAERVRHAKADGTVRIGAEAVPGGVRITIDHGATSRATAEEALARRLLATHHGRVEERDGRTTIVLPTT